MGMMHDVEWRVRVEIPGTRGWWWITMPMGGVPDVTRDIRLAAQVIDPSVAGILVDALNERRGRHQFTLASNHEVQRAR